MGTRLPRHLVDYARFELDVGVRCARCDRLAVFDPADVLKHFTAKRWPTTIPLTPEPFRCRCGSREVRTVAVPVVLRPQPLPAPRLLLTPIYTQEPRR
ncbi:hypothetical protein [Sphingomonas solaris]|uniref:Uncharacterized protein n=1 Tax=Alterirhizorhabdus solaris TaxID=2529389 RepID=A0A558R9G2_9SPHN|nr:hypothetical protein [Sphingomonas solaris]TVV76025.1 hypothetical protein FOY91_05445 [Sphingomonas solaris]